MWGEAEMPRTVRLRMDICLMIEPNIARIRDLPDSTADTRHDAVVARLRSDTTLVVLGSGTGFTWMEIENMVVISCYMSPNSSARQYDRFMRDLGDVVRAKAHKEVIVGGDFSAKAPAWGSSKTDHRGEAVLLWMAGMGLTVLNEGGEATCIRPNGESHVDLTMANGRAADTVSKWRVLGEESLSDHHYIAFEAGSRGMMGESGSRGRYSGLFVPLSAREPLRAALVAGTGGDSRPPSDTMEYIIETCRKFASVLVEPGDRRP